MVGRVGDGDQLVQVALDKGLGALGKARARLQHAYLDIGEA
jgi:hypothetical protein